MFCWDPNGMHKRVTDPTAPARLNLLVARWLTRHTVRFRDTGEGKGRVGDEAAKGISCPANHIGEGEKK